jgi:hypothetical protein
MEQVLDMNEILLKYATIKDNLRRCHGCDEQRPQADITRCATCKVFRCCNKV